MFLLSYWLSFTSWDMPAFSLPQVVYISYFSHLEYLCSLLAKLKGSFQWVTGNPLICHRAGQFLSAWYKPRHSLEPLFFSNIIFFISYLGTLYNAPDHIRVPFLPGPLPHLCTSHLRITESTLWCPSTYWSTVRLPSPLPPSHASPEAISCQEPHFSVCTTVS